MVLLNKLVVSLWNLGHCFDKCLSVSMDVVRGITALCKLETN